jgi:hypothetical protein
MPISLNQKYFESDNSYLKIIDSTMTRRIISPRNNARRSGLICNYSKYDLHVWFGLTAPVHGADWLILPHGSNCDIPLFFTGDIYGFWDGNDNKAAKIYEFYGT